MNAPEKHDPNAAIAERQRMRLEQLLIVSRRLVGAISDDIAALEKGAFNELKTTEPEIERLCAFYGREIRTLKSEGGVTRAPAPLIAELRESGATLERLLKHHERLVAAMREAAEGLVKTVAEGVEKLRTGDAPYTPAPKSKRTARGGAIVYNKVV